MIIVGAGPTGLMAANQLQRFGIDFIILDSKSGPTEQSRAIAVTARSLEIYQQLGISDYALENGARINSFNVYSGGKRKAEVKIGEIGKGLTGFHYLLGFEQSQNEKLLYTHLKNKGQDVWWNTEFLQLTEYKNSIELTARQNDKEISLSARYLIACDGARSAIRHQLQFDFRGGTYENKFFVADVVQNWDLEYDRLIVSPADKNFCAFFPLKAGRHYRVLGTLPREYFGKEDITFSDIEQIVKKTFVYPVEFEQVNWFSVYKLHHRCVSLFSKERVFLAGDSAHIHSPAGGQGMNTGLQDAYNLAWKLSLVLKGHAKPALLKTYNEERLTFAKWLLGFTDRLFTMMTSDNWFIARARKYIGLNIMGKIITLKKLRPRIFKTVSQTWYSYKRKSLSLHLSKQKLSFRAGDRLPFIKEKIYLQFTEPSFHLLHIWDNTINNEVLKKIQQTFSFPLKTVEHPLNEEWKKQGVSSELYILVRPDNYMAVVTDVWDEIKIKSKFQNFFIA